MKKLTTLTLTTLLVVILSLTPVLATPNTKLDFIQDVAPGGSPADADMDGPTGFGFVNYNQDAEGNLRLTVVLKNAEPNMEYDLDLTWGPTHSQAMGWITVGTLTTNINGNGACTVIVDVATLQAAPGGGDRTDHLDVLGAGYPATQGGYVVSVLEYTVP